MKVNIKWIKVLGNASFILAIGFSLYLIVNFLVLRSNSPPGVCPAQKNRPLIYATMALALTSLILSVMENRFKRD